MPQRTTNRQPSSKHQEAAKTLEDAEAAYLLSFGWVEADPIAGRRFWKKARTLSIVPQHRAIEEQKAVWVSLTERSR